MFSVNFRFYEELNDFLPLERRKRDFTIPYRAQNSIKDMIESVGVPHTEVDFSYIVQTNDRVSVYPVFESFDISSLNRLKTYVFAVYAFRTGCLSLGRLARYLRLLWFDALYSNSYEDVELVEISSSGNKQISLTRDHGLLKRKLVSHGYFVRNDIPELQLREIISRFDLYNTVKPFTSCTRCNGLIQAISKEQVLDRLPGQVTMSLMTFHPV